VSSGRVALEASRSPAAAGLQNCADPPAAQRVQATILVRPETSAAAQARVDAILRGDEPAMSREEAAQTLGADPRDIEAVTDFAQAYGLQVIESSAPERSVKVSGTVAQMEAAFAAKLRACTDGLYYEGTLSVPSSLDGVIKGVLGLDQRPIANSR
jgi:kumamolisin